MNYPAKKVLFGNGEGETVGRYPVWTVLRYSGARKTSIESEFVWREPHRACRIARPAAVKSLGFGFRGKKEGNVRERASLLKSATLDRKEQVSLSSSL